MKNLFYCLIISLLILGCTPAGLKNDKAEEPNDPYATEGTSTADVASSPFDSVTSQTVGYRYWYVYYSTETMEGFLISRSTKTGFSLIETVALIRSSKPSVKADEFVGVKFFAEVNRECYDEYYADNQ